METGDKKEDETRVKATSKGEKWGGKRTKKEKEQKVGNGSEIMSRRTE